jgi:hypothetical protein
VLHRVWVPSDVVASAVCGLLAVCEHGSSSRTHILLHSVRLLSLLSKQCPLLFLLIICFGLPLFNSCGPFCIVLDAVSAKDWLTTPACDVLQAGVSDGVLTGSALEDAKSVLTCSHCCSVLGFAPVGV